MYLNKYKCETFVTPSHINVVVHIELGLTKCYNWYKTQSPISWSLCQTPDCLLICLYINTHTHTQKRTERPLSTIPKLNIRSVVLGLAKRWWERERGRESPVCDRLFIVAKNNMTKHTTKELTQLPQFQNSLSAYSCR